MPSKLNRISQFVHVRLRAGIRMAVILLGLMAVMAVAVGVRLITPVVRRRRLAAELREDWWPAFERELQAYASRASAAAREAERGS